MSEASFYLTLGKVIIAAAWADGEVAHDEVNCLKDLLFRLPGLTGREWAMLEMYIEAPVGAVERERLVEQLQHELGSSGNKSLALQSLDDLVMADGHVTEEEKVIVNEIKAQIESANVGVFSQLGRVVKNSIQRREAALSDVPNREEHFEDFIKNKVFYEVQRRLKLEKASLDISEDRLRKLSLAGGLMARVAHVDLDVSDDEYKAIANSLIAEWGVSTEEAAFVTEVAVSEIGPDMDYYRLAREFFTSTDRDERVKFLTILFSIANADGFVSNEEIEEIRAIANSLRMTHRQFIDAKKTIPKDKRAS
ncbi:MAG: TerB family tellurite resistance protein [Anaerolineales bacterium]|nr:TerB family tellurite resistance protein [Anaerolineales bacterium]MCK5633783.1 TerB family tellurite resistance protein [Anaerolineales bacterium]